MTRSTEFRCEQSRRRCRLYRPVLTDLIRVPDDKYVRNFPRICLTLRVRRSLEGSRASTCSGLLKNYCRKIRTTSSVGWLRPKRTRSLRSLCQTSQTARGECRKGKLVQLKERRRKRMHNIELRKLFSGRLLRGCSLYAGRVYIRVFSRNTHGTSFWFQREIAPALAIVVVRIGGVDGGTNEFQALIQSVRV